MIEWRKLEPLLGFYSSRTLSKYEQKCFAFSLNFGFVFCAFSEENVQKLGRPNNQDQHFSDGLWPC